VTTGTRATGIFVHVPHAAPPAAGLPRFSSPTGAVGTEVARRERKAFFPSQEPPPSSNSEVSRGLMPDQGRNPPDELGNCLIGLAAESSKPVMAIGAAKLRFCRSPEGNLFRVGAPSIREHVVELPRPFVHRIVAAKESACRGETACQNIALPGDGPLERKSMARAKVRLTRSISPSAAARRICPMRLM